MATTTNDDDDDDDIDDDGTVYPREVVHPKTSPLEHIHKLHAYKCERNIYINCISKEA